LIELLLILAAGVLLHASLDPEFREITVDNARNILSFFVILTVLMLLSGVIHSHMFNRGFMINVYVLAIYATGLCGFYLMRRSLVLPKRRAYVTLVMGFMLIVLSVYFFDGLLLQGV